MKKQQPPDYFDVAVSKNTAAKTRANDFYVRVYEVVAQIPEGKVTTYGTIAEFLGSKGSSRMVGYAMGAVPEDMGIHPHRVINRIGALSAAHKFGGYKRMRYLLEREGISFKGEKVDMDKHFWKPKKNKT